MDKLSTLLKETLIIKNLSPERGAAFIGCSGQQVRRWIEGKVKPSPIHREAIKAGISKINREIPGDTPDGLVSWRAVEIPKGEEVIDKKLTAFFAELLEKAGAGGRSIVIKLADEHFPGFEQIVHLAAKLKVNLPEI